jgi:hypothetical protein
MATKGYYWEPLRNRWHVQIRRNGKVVSLGRYKLEETAQAVYAAALEEEAGAPADRAPATQAG